MKNSQLQDEKPGEWIKGATVIAGVDYSGLEKKIKKAAEGCPVEVIKYDEDDGVLAEMFEDDRPASME